MDLACVIEFKNHLGTDWVDPDADGHINAAFSFSLTADL
jgi:hypothetical protein